MTHTKGVVILPFYSRILDRKSTRLNSSHSQISYAVFCLKKQTWSSAPPGHAASAGHLVLPPRGDRELAVNASGFGLINSGALPVSFLGPGHPLIRVPCCR